MEGFYTQEDVWRLAEEVKALRLEQLQHARQIGQHGDRLSRLERRGDDSRLRSLWTSCFPPVQTGSNFPQLNPSFQPDTSLETFEGFDGQQQHALVAGLAGLPLDDVDVPRRGASRANSVRFDETAIQNHWTPDSQISNEYFPHRPNSMGGHPMTERSSSLKSDYKSEGRHSSVRSMRSFDNYSMVDSEAGVQLPSSQNELECHASATPALVRPPVIRCWLGKAFSCETILYAVICTGSSKSLIDKSLISRSGLSELVWQENGENRVSASLYLADAIVPPERVASSNTLPRLKGEFIVVDISENVNNPNSIGIVLGSDILAAIQADVMFSKSQMNFLVTDGRAVQVDFAQLGPEIQYPASCGLNAIRTRPVEGGQPNNLSQERVTQKLEQTAADSLDISLKEPMSNKGTISQQEKSEEDSEDSSSTMAKTEIKSSISVADLKDIFQNSKTSDNPVFNNGQTSQFSQRTRSKSYGNLSPTSPTSDKSSQWGKDSGRNVWESWRKVSDSTTVEKTSSETGNNPKPTRAMKVLRTAKSTASFVGGNQSKEENDSPKPAYSAKVSTTKLNDTKPGKLSQQPSQASSVTNSPRPGPTKSRSSTNVVGSASAFHWMNEKYD